MASSQVEIASSSPFSCVLRDRNRRDGCRESKWRNYLVKDQNLHPCIPVPQDSSASNENENSCWLPTNLQFSSDNRNKCTNSNIKESDRFSSRKDKEMATPKAERKKAQETLLLPQSDILAPETSNLGAASLVQIWEKRLNRSNNTKISNLAISDDSGWSCNENNASSSSSSSSSSSPRSSESEAGHSVFEESFDSSADWQSDRTALSEQPSLCQSRNSNAGENEKVRVADIIKRLTAANQGQNTFSCSSFSDNDNGGHEQSNSPCDRLSPRSDQMEHRIFSPRVRGRQAFTDFLMLMEKERHGELNVLIERKAVSRFPQKGRIQSMLRLRLLQRGTVIQDAQRPRFAAASQVQRLPQGSTIMHLRERFTIGVEHATTSPSDATTESRSPEKETTNNTPNLEKSSVPKKPEEQIQNQEVNFIDKQDRTTLVHDPPVHNIKETNKESGPSTPIQEATTATQDPLVCNNKDIHEESSPLNSVQDTINLVEEPLVHNYKDISEELGPLTPVQVTITPLQGPLGHNSEDMHKEPGHSIQNKKTSVQDPQAHNIEDTHEEPGPSSSITWQETSTGYRYPDAQDTADATTSCGGWDGNDAAEELQENYQEYAEISYDWISNISRPRRYWEDHRQEWYHEMLNSDSENTEIRQLLERGTVSSFLASAFRERMDRLMVTRLEIRQAQPAGCSQGGEDDEGHSQLMSFIQNHQQRKQQQEHEMEDEEIEREEQEQGGREVEQEESLISSQSRDASDYFDQSTLSPLQVPTQSLLRSWSFQDNEVGDESDRAPSTSPCQDFPSQIYYPNTLQCTSSRNHPSIEMELICELRGQMEQLYQEMSELRKSVKSCMDTQMILLQNSMKQEVHSVSVEGEKKSSGRAVPKKGNCFICYEMKVDSLLYRCGHMCTCLKCARELQWSSGKCPICRAPIEDVVRAYLEMDS